MIKGQCKSVYLIRFSVRRGRIGSGVCFPPQRTKERNLKLPTDLFMIYSSMKNQQMSLVAFFLPKNLLPQGDEFSKESNNRSLKEKSTAKRLTIKQLMELVCIGSQKVCIGSQKAIPSLSRADWACCKAQRPRNFPGTVACPCNPSH